MRFSECPGREVLVAFALALALPACVIDGEPPAVSTSGAALFSSPQSSPLALSADGTLLFAANTTSGSVSVLDVSDPGSPKEIAQIKVGLDPVSVVARPKVDPGDPTEDELFFVSNYISDSINVISRSKLDVVQTLQGLAPDGVTTTDEPVGIAFAGPFLGFVALDQDNQVLVIDVDADGHASLRSSRLPITAQAPRAVAVAGDRLYVVPFESGNQTEFPACGPDDERGLDIGNPHDEGCEFNLELIEDIIIEFGPFGFNVQLGTIFNFAAVDPNIGGQVIVDRDLPDRDLFVFDLGAPDFDSDPGRPGVQPLEVVDGVGTLLYDVQAGPSGRVYVTNTEARNELDGLFDLENRMFDNRISYLDCGGGGGCSGLTHVDLDASAGSDGNVPTPYGLEISDDGAVLVVTGAGSDGVAPGTDGTHPDQPELYGLAVLDADGQVLGGVRVGAIPQGVALWSNPETGAAELAYV
ncbi:MAG: hypothetical protein MJE66_24890, partial [Proteobacteria bacterium]|nr:hypothetical protein [Pseudomonadota bacterium]